MNTTEDILVQVVCDETYMTIRTYCRTHGRRGRILLFSDVVWNAMWNHDKHHYDSDCGHMVKLQTRGDFLAFEVFWLTYYIGDTVDGIVQRFMLPTSDLSLLLCKYGSQSFLCRSSHRQAVINTSHAERTLHSVIADKQKRRALSKAMRDCFQWPGDTVYLCSDGKTDFYFTTESGYPANGGLVLHEKCNTPYGGYYYSVHT